MKKHIKNNSLIYQNFDMGIKDMTIDINSSLIKYDSDFIKNNI